jgi:VWFA-related protein
METSSTNIMQAARSRRRLLIAAKVLLCSLFFASVWAVPVGASLSGPFADEMGSNREATVSDAADALQFTYDRVLAGNFPAIVSYVTVQNDSGIKVSGLTKDNFIVHEDGVRELPIIVEELGGFAGQLSIVMVMDVSGSMSEEIADAQKAATTFVSLANAPDQIALIAFDKTVRTVLGFTKDKNAVVNAINALQLGDGTAVYDATSQAYDLALTASGRRAIILLTDGKDNSSKITLPALLQKLGNQTVPVYAIGLGLKPGKAEEQELRAIADTSGGLYYYSPTSQQLEEIYKAIALLLYRSNYRITYTTHNCAMDGTLRNVRIDVQHKGMTASGTNKYAAPNHFVTLTATADSVPAPGRNLRVRIEIPATSNELLSLSELKLALNYNARYLKVKTPVTQNVIAGPLFGAAGEFTMTANDAAGALTLQLKRKLGLPPVKGRGVVAEVIFVADKAMPDSTQLRFELVNLELRNDRGCAIITRQEALSLYSNGLMVWPGDTNHNGKVELTDVLVLGLYWDMNGPPRTGPENQLAWIPHLASRYPIRAATHADADGSGGIIERDLIPIGLNWGKVATAAAPKAAQTAAQLPEGEMRVAISPAGQAGEYRLRLSFASHNDAELAGVTFRVIYPHAGVNIVSGQAGTVWLEPPLIVTHHDAAARTFAMGVMTPAGANMPRFSFGNQTKESRGGELVDMLVRANRQPMVADFIFKDVALVAADGRIRELAVQTGVGATSEALPQSFTFYPAYPNPISTAAKNSQTTWRYYLPENATVKAGIYNTFGQQVRSFEQPEAASGYHALIWNGADAQGRRIGSGLYFVAIEAVGRDGKIYRSTQKITVVK